VFVSRSETREIELTQLFGNIDEPLSITSKERVISNSKYAAALKARNGLELWKIVHVTHQLTNLLQTLPQQIEAAQRNYY
jgi:hypothetical protein